MVCIRFIWVVFDLYGLYLVYMVCIWFIWFVFGLYGLYLVYMVGIRFMWFVFGLYGLYLVYMVCIWFSLTTQQFHIRVIQWLYQNAVVIVLLIKLSSILNTY